MPSNTRGADGRGFRFRVNWAVPLERAFGSLFVQSSAAARCAAALLIVPQRESEALTARIHAWVGVQ